MAIKAKIAKAVVKALSKTKAGGKVVQAITRSKVGQRVIAPLSRTISKIPSASMLRSTLPKVTQKAIQRVQAATRNIGAPKGLAGRLKSFAGQAALAAGITVAGGYVGNKVLQRMQANKDISSAGNTDYGQSTNPAIAGSTETGGEDYMARLATLGGTAALAAGGLYAAEQVAERLGVRGGAGFIGSRPTMRGRRTMRVTNVKALNKSIRRVAGFHKLATKVQRTLSKYAPRRRQRDTLSMQEARIARQALRGY